MFSGVLLFIYLNLEIDLERERHIYMLVHSPNDCSDEDWAKRKPGAGRCIWISCMGGYHLLLSLLISKDLS